MHFFEGLGASSRGSKKPLREWVYRAAIYHHPITREPYCSPDCATAALGRG